MLLSPTRVAFLGFGNVGRALHALLLRRRDSLARESGIEWRTTGVASRRLGWIANDDLDPANPSGTSCPNIGEWLDACRPDVVFEALALDPHTGQPALGYARTILQHGAHLVSANKGPVVHGYAELSALAAAHGRRYRFEAAVMDGAPVFSLARHCLPVAGLCRVRGVFTSTATIILEAIERGQTLADGIAEAQRLGIAEADPSYDVDGWDSAMKLCAVANVLLGGDLRPADVARTSLRELSDGDIRRSAADGRPYRLVGEVARDGSGRVHASVAPVHCAGDDPLGAVHGTTLRMHYDADVFRGGLTVTSHDPDPSTTAYGMLADLVDVLR